MRRSTFAVLGILLSAALFAVPLGCGKTSFLGKRAKAIDVAARSARLQGVSLNNPLEPAANNDSIILAAARNEVATFALQTTGLPTPSAGAAFVVRFNALNRLDGGGTIAAANCHAYQLLDMPVDVNRAGFVRHTGLAAGKNAVPRALLPLSMKSDGLLSLAQLRDPAKPTDRAGHADLSRPALLYVDLAVPTDTEGGDYSAAVEIVATDGKVFSAPVASVEVRLTVYNFVLPDARHLVVVGSIDWQALRQLYPHFESIEPRLMNRGDERYRASIRTIDGLMALAEEHRVQVVVPRLQPTTKWPAGRLPQVDWSDYDTVVAPWLSGDAFSDKSPLPYWPLPQIDYLNNYPPAARGEYWAEVASHFAQKDWINRSSVFLEKLTPGRASGADAIALSVEAQRVLAAHPQIRVSVPLTDDQIVLNTADRGLGVDPNATARLLSASPSLVFSTPQQNWPEGVTPPLHWLRTDLPGLLPYVGAGGDERDVRLWAWLAFSPQRPLHGSHQLRRRQQHDLYAIRRPAPAHHQAERGRRSE